MKNTNATKTYIKTRSELKRDSRTAFDMVMFHADAGNQELADFWRAEVAKIEAELKSRK